MDRAIDTSGAISHGRPGAGSHALMDGTRVTVNPPTDQAFGARVREVLATASSPEELEELLRPDYPSVRVVRGVTDMVDRWYVYREGRWTNS